MADLVWRQLVHSTWQTHRGIVGLEPKDAVTPLKDFDLLETIRLELQTILDCLDWRRAGSERRKRER